jgi:glycosyltransferase involved in cell wall biosynthesis
MEALGVRVTRLQEIHWLLLRKLPRKLWVQIESRRALRAHKDLIRVRKPSLVYANTLVNSSAILAAHECGVPCVWHVRETLKAFGGEMHPPLGGEREIARRLALADRTVYVSEGLRQQVNPQSATSTSFVVPNAVTDDYFEPAPSMAPKFGSGAMPKRIAIGLPGTLRPIKGHEEFLDVFAAICKDLPEAHLYITGSVDHAFGQRVVRKTESLNLSQHVTFLGHRTDMRSFYDQCDFICVPSRQEPFGRIAIEAMARGKPVIASAIGGLKEIISHEKDGILIPIGDNEAFARAVVSLAEDPVLRDEIASAAHNTARTSFAHAKLSDQLAQVIKNIFID